MALFEDQSESDYKRAITLVEQTIVLLGADLGTARVRDGRYSLKEGSASIVVSVSRSGTNLPHGSLRLVSPVVKLPEKQETLFELFRHLLDVNAKSIANAAFGVDGDFVVVVSERALRDLNGSEVEAMMRTVGTIADFYDDDLAARFGTVRACDVPEGTPRTR